jgi:hypothetical protein
MACRTCRQSVWTPASATVRPLDTRLDTVSADRFLLRTPDSGWPGDGHAGPLERPVGRTSPVPWDRPADGYGPVRTAADTSSAQRPTCAWPAGHGQPRGLDVLALTGRHGSAHAPFGNPSRYQHRDLSVVTPALRAGCRNGRSLVPSDVRGRVRRPHGRRDQTAFRTPHVRSIRPDTVHSTPHAMAKPEATRTGNGRTAWVAFGHPRSPRPQGGPPGHAEPLWGRRCGLATRLARRWQACQRDRNHGSDQAAAWYRSTVQAAPWRTAVLRRMSGRG